MQVDPTEPRNLNRREMLLRTGGGFGALALAALMDGEVLSSETQDPGTTPPGNSIIHRPQRARNVIFLFMEGGPSHLDLTDPKPALQKLAGKPLPDSYDRIITAMGEFDSPVLPDQRKWKQHGESGQWFSDWIPNIARHADDLAVLRSVWTNGINHSGGVCQMNTGTQFAGRPSLGAWVNYGLGSANQNLPSFVVMQDRKGTVVNGPRNWGSGFMPATLQGAAMEFEGEPFPNLTKPEHINSRQQRLSLDFLKKLNQRHQQVRQENTELEARIRSYELAYQMQAHAPEAIDLSQETATTHELYGLNNKETASFGKNCLLARRFVERGVRFVQCYHGAGSKWDAHSKIESNHSTMCKQMDQPVSALLTDLKRRGMLDETLVVWGGEFGRTPMSEKGDGRDHNPTGFSMWMAGGGVRAGQPYGSTDEVGLHAVEDRLHVHDVHSTILALLGVDHRKLVYLHKGRMERIDQNEGRVFRDILG